MVTPPTVPIQRVLPRSGAGTLTPREAHALLKVAFLAGEADGEVADEEESAFRSLAHGLRKLVKETPPMTDAALDAMLAELSELIEKKGNPAAIKQIAEACARPLARDLAYKIAVAMSVADFDKSDDESDFDAELMEALKITEEQADLLAQDVYAALDADA